MAKAPQQSAHPNAPPAQKTQTQTAAPRPKLFTEEQITHHLVKAQPIFKTVVAQDRSPLIWESELDFARNIVMNDSTERLRQVVPDTLAACLRNLAHVGLTLNPIKKYCTLIARWNDKLKVLEAHIMFMYRGLVFLATQAGVQDIQCDVVYKADLFSITKTSEGDGFKHEIAVQVPRDDKDNVFLGVYVAARMPASKERKVEWIPREDIFKMRDLSDSYRDSQGNIRPKSPWVMWFDEMGKKSGTKRATKRWEESVENRVAWDRLHRAIELDNVAERGETIEGTAVEVAVPKLSVEQIATIETKAKELGHGDVQKYMRRICAAYGTEVLADVPAKMYGEVLERIEASRKEMTKRRESEKK